MQGAGERRARFTHAANLSIACRAAIVLEVMTTLAQQLDECLRTVDEETARRLVQIVNDAMALAEIAKAGRGADHWPAGYFQQTAGALAGERFERPDQGQVEIRETW